MDQSKQYIKMCDCDEIQSQWTIKSARWCDVFYDPEDVSINKCMNLIHVKDCFEEGIKLVWLPRQDQLQDMLGYQIGGMLDLFCEWIDTAEFAEGSSDTMEKIWLSFVMHEKFNKKWNGERWV